MDEMNNLQSDLVQVVRLALSEQTEDVRLFAAKLVRKYRGTDPDLAKQVDLFLRTKPQRPERILRKNNFSALPEQTLPINDESRLSLLKVFKTYPYKEDPLLTDDLKDTLGQLIQERKQIKRLAALGLEPSKSAVFIGRPGVGKTLTARWLASQLDVPLYVLDLTAVMSSLLGRSGGNVRTALDFAKSNPCILLLDEIDAIAKRRSDDSDIGELKRLVTVILQEIDEWPSTGLLLAATNHPELIDPALWRRFDLVVKFKLPGELEVKEAIQRFLGSDLVLFSRWIDTLVPVFIGYSFSEIEREIQRFRRAIALGTMSNEDLVKEFIKIRTSSLDRNSRIKLAVFLAKETKLSQYSISDITGVSRDTIRKYSVADTVLPSKKQRNRK